MLRTRFGQIVAEFIAPSSVTRKVEVALKGRKKVKNVDAPNAKVIILASGAPSVPSKKSLMEFLAKKGYWVFFPRYRGTWESDGRFLAKSPEKDILDVLDALPKGFKDYWNDVTYTVQPKKAYIIGASFGGPAAIIGSLDPRVTKAVGISPVIDWSKLGPRETFAVFKKFTNDLFGNVYRATLKDWKRLERGEIYNPLKHIKEIDGSKLFLIQTKDDDSVPWRTVASFAKKTKSKLQLYKTGGHLGLSYLIKPSIWKKINAFLKTK